MNRITIFIIVLFFGGKLYQSTNDSGFYYQDLTLFETAIAALENNTDSLGVFSEYINSSSQGYKGWASRNQVSPELFVQRYANHPEIFNQLPDFEEPLKERETYVRSGFEKLKKMANNDVDIPVYYFVTNQHIMGGTPLMVDNTIVVGVAVGVYPGSEDNFDIDSTADQISYVAVHEASHIFQLHAQGGLENYRSIYSAEGGSMVAVAIREGCAEYVTYLATGDYLGDRKVYVDMHEKELWSAFKEIAFEPPFSVPGWFNGVSESNPDWPFQVGYSLGFKMCETYHLAADNPDERLPELFALYNEADIQKVWKVYDDSFQH